MNLQEFWVALPDEFLSNIPPEVIMTGILWCLLVFYFFVEYVLHLRTLSRIPVRVHVNGTRGKTSVTRLIAAGLRAGGKRVCAKTSGTVASVTDEDGIEFPVFRFSQPNIIEQMRVMRQVAKSSPDAVVFECMALQPRFQSLTETHMIRSTHGVITNARSDHLDVMGPTGEDVAIALSGSTPVRGKLFTCEQHYISKFEASAADRGTDLTQVSRADIESITDEHLRHFKYREHAENVALALTVCESLGVSRETALLGMASLEPEPGATQVCRLMFHGRELIFVNAFAANDPESTRTIWEKVTGRYGKEDGYRRIAVVNCRADRPQRSHQIAIAASQWSETDHFIVIGSGTIIFLREALKHGIPPERITVEESVPMREVIESILERCGRRAVIVGMANIKGGGREIARYFGNRASQMEPL